MNNDKAIALLRRMQEPEAYEPQITAEAFEALDMAIKALEQADHIADDSKKATQPELAQNLHTTCTDTISRQAAIDEIRRCRFVVDAIEKISKLPSVQPEQPWIPVSEKPIEKGLMFVTYNDGDVDLLKQPTAYRRSDIVAWMPLPEPWKEGEADESD